MEFGFDGYIFTRYMLKKILWILILLTVGSCLEKPDCFQLSNNFIGISFKKIFDGKADTLSFIGITSPSSDSIFYQFTNASSIQLPLNPYEPSTTLNLETIFNSYQLAIGYKSVVQFVSEDCGARTTLSALAVNSNTFDSIKIISTFFANPAAKNLEVYRCPRTNQLKLAFRKLVNGVNVADTVELTNVTADSGTPFYFPAEKITRINLPLNPVANTTTFTFNFSDGATRSLTIQHTRTPWNEYTTCNELTLFSKLSNSGSTFSQVTLVRDSIQDPPLTNFAIFK